MPQGIAVLPASTVIDNVTLGAEPVRRGLRSPRACRTSTETALAKVGLEVDPSALAVSLSAAHQRMLIMARALDREARLLILDEPTAGLPHHQAELIGAAVRRVVADGVTVIYVSHHLSELAELCERVTCVRAGRVTATLAGDQISKDALVAMLLDVPADAEVSSARRTNAASNGHQVTAPEVALRGVSGVRLRDVTVTAKRAQVTGVTGLLGSGVSELVSMVVGAWQRSSGGSVGSAPSAATGARQGERLPHHPVREGGL